MKIETPLIVSRSEVETVWREIPIPVQQLEYVAGDLIARYGSEQFGLGRLDGQADAQAVAQILSASARPDPMTLRLD